MLQEILKISEKHIHTNAKNKKQKTKQTILCKLHQNMDKMEKSIQTFCEASLILIPKQEQQN